MDSTTFNTARYGIFLAVLVMSVVTHEFFHGWSAWKCGDPTAKDAGRLTFNPLVHIDPFMTVLLPLMTLMAFGFPFGGAKPVPVNPFFLTRKNDMWVSLAGPASNLALALGFFLLMLLLHPFVPYVESLGFWVLYGGIAINLVLAVFNMIPIPPLDGSHVLSYFIPSLEEPFHRIGGAGMLLVIMVVWAGGFGLVVGPVLGVMNLGVELIYGRLG